MKTNTVYKRALNRCLGMLTERDLGSDLGSEQHLAELLNVSRTTVRAVLVTLEAAGLVAPVEGRKRLLRHPTAADYFPDVETESARTIAEKKFMAFILDRDCMPGQQINGLDLARQFGVSTSTIREYLNHFSRFGLIERRPNSSWVFKGFTEEFGLELCEVREILELRSAQKFAALEQDDPAWARLEQIEYQHKVLLAEIDRRYKDFSELDERFHRLIYDASRNRFFVEFYDVISLIFHYHYQWSKVGEKSRNSVAIREHLAYIDALKRRDIASVRSACRAHMETARSTFLQSLKRIGAPTAEGFCSGAGGKKNRLTRTAADRFLWLTNKS